MEIRLKFRSTGHFALSNMSKLIPNCSNQWKIIFWAWWGVNFIEMKNFKKQKSFILWSEPMVKWFLAKSKFCNLSPPPTSCTVNLQQAIIAFYVAPTVYDLIVTAWPWIMWNLVFRLGMDIRKILEWKLKDKPLTLQCMALNYGVRQ